MARLRIVGGTLGGRRIEVPHGGAALRPTSERLREAVASALEARDAVLGRRVLDLFAGTGALAFEALSRGASTALLLERDPATLRAIRQNAASLGLEGRVRTCLADLLDSTKKAVAAVRADAEPPFDLVFCDPPYARSAELGHLFGSLLVSGAIAPGAWVVIERAAHASADPPDTSLVLERDYRHGDCAAGVFRFVVPS